MYHKAIVCIALLASVMVAQEIQVISQGKDSGEEVSRETMIEIVVDSASKDSDLPLSLHKFENYGTAYGYNTSVTFFSNEKVSELPATINVPNGKYNLIANNDEPFGHTGLEVDATGGYQKWLITAGDHKKAKLGYKLGRTSLIYGLSIGVSMIVTGHLMQGISADTPSETDLEYGNTYETDTGYRGLLIAGYATSAGALCVGIPSLAMHKRNRMRAEQVESMSAAPMNALELQGVAQ